jgi:hypothetical protein
MMPGNSSSEMNDMSMFIMPPFHMTQQHHSIFQQAEHFNSSSNNSFDVLNQSHSKAKKKAGLSSSYYKIGGVGHQSHKSFNKHAPLGIGVGYA